VPRSLPGPHDRINDDLDEELYICSSSSCSVARTTIITGPVPTGFSRFSGLF
jgi:hypothetical protein